MEVFMKVLLFTTLIPLIALLNLATEIPHERKYDQFFIDAGTIAVAIALSVDLSLDYPLFTSAIGKVILVVGGAGAILVLGPLLLRRISKYQ